ncbi:hypothetical protein [Siphonobacter sp. SORGH_AS_1065]|uniref:hypothetical protein n=1 Tax=Siphonobacter sp. SORGH_AS_1065 TaxID=3041795 RepID=UPI00277FE0A4|nr:hypothetical protein [Siphonobacter sp. SORGH_AS_1065]MDQ1088983.1 hypothetical protein [Siphonobacter sp. SORGH_AS_1065]
MGVSEQIMKDLRPVLEEVIQDGIEEFKRALEAKGLVLTEELKRNFSYQLTESATELAGTISFQGYGRFKDMAKVSYLLHAPPIEAMEEYVEKIGVDKFAYVPGYRGKAKIPTTDRSTLRIAWALARSRRQVPSVKRGYRGTWYNSSKVNMINIARRKIAARYSELLTHFMAGILENPD